MNLVARFSAFLLVATLHFAAPARAARFVQDACEEIRMSATGDLRFSRDLSVAALEAALGKHGELRGRRISRVAAYRIQWLSGTWR